MESFPPYKEIDHPAMPKSRLNSLLIILMVTLLASGGALIFLKQIDAYHRQQIYIAEQAALPIHKTTSSKPTFKVKTFASPELGFIQDYAEFYEMSEISANETFPVLSYEKGPKGYQKGYRFASSLSSVFCPVLEVLVYSTEEKTVTNWLSSNTDIKRAFAEQSSETINGVQFIRLAGPAGDIVPSQVYLVLKNKNLYQLNLNFGLKGDGVDPKCGDILSGFELTSEDWKTYRNEEYGFEFEYPSSWSVSDNNTGPAYDTSKPFILLSYGKVSNEPCNEYGCPPKPGDRDELTTGDTYQGGPPFNPWFKILRVFGDTAVSIQVTDVNTQCDSPGFCQKYLAAAPFSQRKKLTDINYETYNDFIDLISTFKFTK